MSRRLAALAALAALAPFPATATPTTSTSTVVTTPNTDSCPQRVTPPPAADESEAPKPGHTTPTPLPVPDVQPGGEKLQGCGMITPPGFAVPDGVTAAAWMVFDLDSGDIFATKDPHGRYRPASVIKVLLATQVIDRLTLTDTVTVKEEGLDQVEGSMAGIGPGGQYSVEQLLQGLILNSGNDTAWALAQELGGDQKTLGLINDYAVHTLGTTDTRVMSYDGLDRPGNSTSVYDLALMYSAATQREEFVRLIGTQSVQFPGYKENPGFEMWTDNQLLLNDPTAIGGKTGYTDDARHSFFGAVNKDGHRLGAVILGGEVGSLRAWQMAQALLHATDPTTMTPVGQLTLAAAAQTPVPTVSPSPAPSQTPGAEPELNSALGFRLARYGIPVLILVLVIVAGRTTMRRR